jgi:mono/diheme cytochrome c family protein
VPFGKGSDFIRNHPALKGVSLPDRLGTAGGGAPIVTRGGLVFIGGGEAALTIVDKTTGAELRRIELPRRGNGTPMAYRTRSGRQFVLMATGSGSDAMLVAFALGDQAARAPAPAGAAAAITTSSISGRTAFDRVCATCHGAEAAGAVAPRLTPFKIGEQELRAIVREGKGQMPAMSAVTVSDEEVRALADYLRQLR